VRVVSWNIAFRGPKAAKRQGSLLRELAPDLMLLQELNPGSSDVLADAAGADWMVRAIDLRTPEPGRRRPKLGDFLEHLSRHRDLGHLKGCVVAVAHDLGPSLHDALGLQRFDVLFAQSHSVKDFGVVLAELGGDRTHTDAAVDLDRCADVRDVAVEKQGEVLANIEIATIPMVKDPWKELNPLK
jgi:hypothetical protein